MSIDWIKHIVPALLIAISVLLTACEEKDAPPAPGSRSSIGDTSYVEITPPWGGFDTPRAVLIGRDQLIYVADSARNEVIMLDAGGTVLQRRSVPHPVAIAQNSKLDLYVAGETVSQNGGDVVGAIYKIYLVRQDTSYVSRIEIAVDPLTSETTYTPVVRDTAHFFNHQLSIAPMRMVYSDESSPKRRFTGIGILPNNEYLVTRAGPENSSFIDPDSRVLFFTKKDITTTKLGDLITRPSGGTAITDINQLTGIMVVTSTRDFILTQKSAGVAYGAVWMVYQNTPEFDGWLPKYDPTKPEQRGVDFIRPYRFLSAAAAAYDQRRRDVFIVDSELDSVIKFDRNGRFKNESFGASRSQSDFFPGLNNPSGIAFSNDCTLYIADTGNKVIRRFKLSTQTTCY